MFWICTPSYSWKKTKKPKPILNSMWKSKCLGEKYLYFYRGTLFIFPDFTRTKSPDRFLMQHRETAMLWDLIVMKSTWSLDIQLLLKVFSCAPCYDCNINTSKVHLYYMKSKCLIKLIFPPQSGRKGLCFQLEVTHLFSLKPVLPTMKWKWNPPTG